MQKEKALLSRQVRLIFELLAERGRPMSAYVISGRLGIDPHNVPRVVAALVDMGLVTERYVTGGTSQAGRLRVYVCHTPQQARKMFLQWAERQFETQFAAELLAGGTNDMMRMLQRRRPSWPPEQQK
jgi:DNA-binding MarR family transcriptional regulator